MRKYEYGQALIFKIAKKKKRKKKTLRFEKFMPAIISLVQDPPNIFFFLWKML